MLTIERTFSRRTLLRATGLFVGGAGLSRLLQLRALSAAESGTVRNTSVILIELGGGPSQFETYDPKPDAPAEYRGEFHPVRTNIPGVQFCELLPKQAQLMDKLAIVRSIHHEQASHIAMHIVETGYDLQSSANAIRGEMPSVGSVVSRMRGVGRSGLPGYVVLPRNFAYASPHWLGAQYQAFHVTDDPNSLDFKVSNLALSQNITVDRLSNRRDLQRKLDGIRKLHDLTGYAESVDTFSQQAFDLVTGERAQRAFNIQEEDEKTRDRYGRTTLGQQMLLARRLVQAEVPYVKVRMGDWDDHVQLPEKIRARAPMFDTALAALIEDLHERGMHRDVLVVAMGEFGRTPRINAQVGRDHFPAVNSVLFSGGDYRMGQVIGATDRNGAKVTSAPYRPQNVLAMVYRHLGIDPGLTFDDYSGRPRHVLEEREPIVELG